MTDRAIEWIQMQKSIRDEHYRRSFLTSVPENAEIASLAEAWLQGGEAG